jgi:hypothetical protein
MLGHFQYEFPTWDEKANYAEFDEEEEMLFVVHIEMKDTLEKVWPFDSCRIYHIYGNKD